MSERIRSRTARIKSGAILALLIYIIGISPVMWLAKHGCLNESVETAVATLYAPLLYPLLYFVEWIIRFMSIWD